MDPPSTPPFRSEGGVPLDEPFEAAESPESPAAVEPLEGAESGPAPFPRRLVVGCTTARFVLPVDLAPVVGFAPFAGEAPVVGLAPVAGEEPPVGRAGRAPPVCRTPDAGLAPAAGRPPGAGRDPCPGRDPGAGLVTGLVTGLVSTVGRAPGCGFVKPFAFFASSITMDSFANCLS